MTKAKSPCLKCGKSESAHGEFGFRDHAFVAHPKQLDAIADTVLAYRPKARSKSAIQRKRRRTILQKKQSTGGRDA